MAKAAKAKKPAANKAAAKQAAPDRATPKPANANPIDRVPALAPAMAEVLGHVTFLMQNSPQHRHLFVSDYDWLVTPPVALKQFRLIRQDGKPVVYVSWALLSEEAEARFLTGNRKLAPNEWNTEGGTPWIVDVVAPFGGTEQVVKSVAESVFKSTGVKVLATAPDGDGFQGHLVNKTDN